MELVEGTGPVAAALKGASLAIGNFDGLHKGHVAVLDAAAAAAGMLGAPFGAVVFEPHPREFFAPHTPLFRLTPLRLKARLMERLGLDVVFVLPFDETLAAMSPEGFATHHLIERLGARHLATGYDFRFGKGRIGTAEGLKEIAALHHVDVTVVAPAHPGGAADVVYSSSAVRRMLEAGDPLGAAYMLGHYWTIRARVIDGDKRGRDIGYPTANMTLPPGLAPRLGIYAVRVLLPGETGFRPAVGYFGKRPTFAEGDIVLEVHVFDFSGDLYGKELEVEFIDFIRPDKTFDAVEPLIEQMKADETRARALLADYAANDPIGKLPWLNRLRPRPGE